MPLPRWIATLGLLGALLAGSAAHAGPVISAAPERIEVAAPTPPPGWETIPGTYAEVSGDPRHARLMLQLANHVAASLPRLATDLGVPIGETVHVYLVSSAEEFRSLQPGRPPMWADATAYPEAGAIFLRAPGLRGATDTPLERVLDHELVHVLIGRAFSPASPPSWLQEGVARVYAGEFGPEDARIIAGRSGGLLTLSELASGFPADPLTARLAYAQSADFVAWLGRTYGPETVPRLIRALAREQALEPAIASATGQALPALERDWLARHDTGPPAWLALLQRGEVFFGAGAIALVGAGIARRREFHRRMTEREAEEREEDERRAAQALRWAVRA